MKFISVVRRNVKAVSDSYWQREKEQEEKRLTVKKKKIVNQGVDLCDMLIYGLLFGGKK